MSRTPSLPTVMMAGLFAVTLLAGCIDGNDPDSAGDVAEEGASVDLDAFVNPIVLDYDHSDPALHDLSWNMERTGGALLDEGVRGYAAPHAMDIKADRLFVSAYAATGDRVAGVYIFDLAADPADPPLLGKWLIEGPGGGDRNMEATADGAYVVVAYEAQDCAGNVGPVGVGMHLIDASDPRDPVEVDHVIIGEGESAAAEQHSITVFSGPTGDFVFHGGGDQALYQIDRDAGALVKVGSFSSGHDSSVFFDPIANMTLLLSADVSELNVYDITDPLNPRIVSSWDVPNPETYYVHTAIAEHIGGRNILIVNSEDFRHDPSSFWVLDMTDHEVLEVLAQWTTPDDIESGDLTFSLHNPRFENGTLTFSYYHAGIWMFDMNDPARWTDPRPMAYYLPHEPVGRAAKPDGEPVMARVCGTLLSGTDGSLDILMDSVPFTFDQEMHDGYVYVADVNTGMHVVRFAPEEAASE